MYGAVRRYKFAAKDGAEIDRKVREAFVSVMQDTPGFVAYYWLDDGNGNGASLSVFKDKVGADASIKAAHEFVTTQLAGLLIGPPDVVEGTVKAYA